MNLQQLLRLSRAFALDRSLYANHIDNGVLTDLYKHKKEIINIIGLIENDENFANDLSNYLYQINTAISLYEHHTTDSDADYTIMLHRIKRSARLKRYQPQYLCLLVPY